MNIDITHDIAVATPLKALNEVRQGEPLPPEFGPRPHHGCLHQLFEAAAREWPNAVAIDVPRGRARPARLLVTDSEAIALLTDASGQDGVGHAAWLRSTEATSSRDFISRAPQRTSKSTSNHFERRERRGCAEDAGDPCCCCCSPGRPPRFHCVLCAYSVFAEPPVATCTTTTIRDAAPRPDLVVPRAPPGPCQRESLCSTWQEFAPIMAPATFSPT